MTDDHHTRTEPAGGPDDSKPSDFGGLTEAAGLGPATPDKDFLLGRVIGGITIVRLIAEGGMGRVYEGLQDKPRRPVAVKVMRPGFVSREACRRFDNEAEVLGRLRHPCIAQIYSAGIYDMMGAPVPYFVMEYIPDALPITKFATQRGLTAEQRLQLFREVCEAVAEGHKQGIVHRDLKPSNILVEPPKTPGRVGAPKIIDFGVARSIDATPEAMTGMTDLGRLIGTLQYMSPEQFLGDPASVDVRADVYALGVVLYELLAGRPPYEIRQQQIFEAARIVREQAPQPVTAANRSVGPAVAQVADTCLRKDPRHRYANAGELAGAVQACLDGATPAGRPVPRAEAAAPVTLATAWLRRAGPYVLTSAGVAIVGFLLLGRDQTPKPNALTTGAPPPHEAGQLLGGGAVTAVALDGSYESRQARVKRRDAEVPRRLVGYPQDYLTCTTENEPHRDRETGELVVPLQLSFDRKKYLALARELATLLKVDDDLSGKVICDGTFWQTVKDVGVTTADEIAKKKEDIFRHEGPFHIKPSDHSLPGRVGEIFPAHRGWNELYTFYKKHLQGVGPSNSWATYPGTIVILLTDISEDFTRTTWEWFDMTNEEFVQLFGRVRPSWVSPALDKTRPTLDCLTTVQGPDFVVIASDTLALYGPGITANSHNRNFGLGVPTSRLSFAVFAPFSMQLTQRFDIEGSPIDWYAPQWFIERRLKMPESTPGQLRVTTSILPLNRLPNANKLQIATNAAGMTLVRIPSGTVRKQLGYYQGVGDSRVVDVRLGKPFWMGQTEVTYAQWQAVMGEPFVPVTEGQGSRDELRESSLKKPKSWPVAATEHEQVVGQLRDFCDRLTTLDRGKSLISAHERYVLPTECQWEYAFLAGEDAVYKDGWCGGEFGWWRQDAKFMPFPVGLLRPNAWGLYDMCGNLAEICDNGSNIRELVGEGSDDPGYGKWTQFTDSQTYEPPTKTKAPHCVLKGGHCWEHQVDGRNVGFRVVRIDTRNP